jgi:subtilase family serine protease
VRSFGWLVVLVFVCSFFVSGLAQTAPKSRILQAVDETNVTPLRGMVHAWARPQLDRGPVDVTMPLGRMAIVFKLSTAQQQDLDNLLKEQQNPASPNYHRWLSPEQYAARFGMSPSDLQKVAGWLQTQGLTVEGYSRGRTEIYFSGTAGQVEYAFHTELHNYSVNGKTRFANATPPLVPAAFADTVLAIRHLNNLRPEPRNVRGHAISIRPSFTSNLSGNHFVTPPDFATIYDLGPLYSAGFDGTGEKIAVVGQSAISTTDIDHFRTNASLPARTSSNFQQIQVPGSGTSTHCSGDETESDLDLEWSEGVAKGATIVFVYTGAVGGNCNNTSNLNVWDSLQYAIDNNVAPVISTSYGLCEAGLGSSFPLTVQQWAQQANSQGQTITAASGDDGAADCDTGSSATQGLAVDVPAAIPEVTGIGGTTLEGDANSPSQFWNSSNGAGGGSALSYIPEIAWNDTSASIAQGTGLAASGGGASTLFAKPTWQTGTGVPNDSKRDVPDLALNASPFHDSYLICSNDYFTSGGSSLTSCSSGYRASDGSTLSAIGGTSAGAPTFAGIVAIINQAIGSNGQGNLNPTLYSLATSAPAAFHDITSGDNKVPCVQNSTNCPSGGTLGFSAGTGYDQVTGLGSVDANALLLAWPGYNTFSLTAAGAVSIPAPGQLGTGTVTIGEVNGFSGTVNLTCTPPSGKGITCSVNPTSVSLDNTTTSASATVTVTTTGASAALKAPATRSDRVVYAAMMLPFLGIVVLGGASRRRTGISALVLLAFLVAGIGCGGGSSTSSNSQNSGTSAGSYTITVTGNDGSVSHAASVSVTVQ